MPYGHPFIPQRISCYAVDVELEPGGRYLLAEDEDQGQAFVIREATHEVVAEGKLVDKAWMFQENCRWK